MKWGCLVNDMHNIRLLSERLRLREVEEGDLEEITSAVNNINVSQYLLVVPHPYSLKDGEDFIKHCQKSRLEKERVNYNLAIEFERKLVGMIGLAAVDPFQETATLGYWVAEEFWRKGIASEAAQRMIRFAFEDLGLRRINVEAFAGNEGSQNLIEKLGFTFEGRRKQFEKSKATGIIHDSLSYGLLREEWETRTKAA